MRDIRREIIKKNSKTSSKFKGERTEKLKRHPEELRIFIQECKNKMQREDKSFLCMKDYFDVMIELGYKKERE